MQDQCSLSPKSVLHCTVCALKLHQMKVQSLVKLLQFKCKVSAAWVQSQCFTALIVNLNLINWRSNHFLGSLRCTDCAIKLRQLKVQSLVKLLQFKCKINAAWDQSQCFIALIMHLNLINWRSNQFLGSELWRPSFGINWRSNVWLNCFSLSARSVQLESKVSASLHWLWT